MTNGTKMTARANEAFIDRLMSIEYDVVANLDFNGYVEKDVAVSALRRFMNRLDILAFGRNEVQRHKRKIPKMVVLDGGDDAARYAGTEKRGKGRPITAEMMRQAEGQEARRLTAGAAQTHNKNWHGHGSFKVAGKLDTREKLLEAVTRLWKEETEKAGRHGEIELAERENERGWHAYLVWKINLNDERKAEDKEFWMEGIDLGGS